MDDSEFPRQPQTTLDIAKETEAMSFGMMSEAKVGALLATLAASKPGGRLLELGTGTGHGTAWLLAGMDSAAVLDTVDTDDNVIAVARRHLGADARVQFHAMDVPAFSRTPSRDSST